MDRHGSTPFRAVDVPPHDHSREATLTPTLQTEVPHPLLSGADAWFRSDDASRCARTHARRCGVPPQDLLAETRARIWRHVDRRPACPLPTSVPAYCARTMRNIANDHLRARPRDLLILDGGRWPEPVAPSFGHPETHDLGDRVRTLLETSGADPAVVAAALAYLTLAEHPEVDLVGLPGPRSGAHEHDARLWPALWIAGERSCLPVDGLADDPAARRRRSRRMRSVKDLLRDVGRRLEGAGR